MAKKKSIYYVSNVELLEEVKLFKACGVCSENLGRMLLLMARNYSSKGNFAGYTWRQDMVSNAVYICLKYLKNFNPEKSTNAFSYITQIIGNAFKLTIIDEKKQSHIKNICFQASLQHPLEDETTYIQKSIDYEGIQNGISENKENIHDMNHLWVEQVVDLQPDRSML